MVKKKILIVEDDQVNQELLKLYLGDTYFINIVSSVAGAIRLLQDEQFHMIITDLYLGNEPEANGLDFLRLVRSNPHTKSIPIVAYSAFNNPNDTNEMQFSAFIPKPINKADFLEAVRKMLPAD